MNLAYNMSIYVGDLMSKYFHDLNFLPQSEIITEMRDYALKNQVPIINDEGLAFLLFLARTLKAKRILEIGTAIGFSAINMAYSDSEIIIDTIERDEEMYKKALINVAAADFSTKINIIHDDALTLDLTKLSGNYDLIFIDAAKAQYTNFFTKYAPLLSETGIIFTDNLLFHGLVATSEEVTSKNLRHLVTKIKDFNQWLKDNTDYCSTFFAIGDGIAVSQRAKR